jgi:hypothetical protein
MSADGGTGIQAAGGANNGTPPTHNGGLGVSATGGDSVWGVGGAGISAVGGNNTNDQGGNGGDGGEFTGGSLGRGGSGGDGISATGGSGEGPAGCGGIFAGGDQGGTACIAQGNDQYLDGADGIFAAVSQTINNPPAYGGNFTGDLNVTGTIFAGTKDFKIDHPLDPANKYLVHASVESSEMMNIYSGNITTDGQGEALVQLPQWFGALNADYRYQLTVIGQFAQAIVARKIEDSQFTIRTSSPNVEVSWQVAGVRRDAFARAHPLLVEEEKPTRLRGYYIHPELYGQPSEKQIEWARHPAVMKRLKEIQQKELKDIGPELAGVGH